MPIQASSMLMVLGDVIGHATGMGGAIAFLGVCGHQYRRSGEWGLGCGRTLNLPCLACNSHHSSFCSTFLATPSTLIIATIATILLLPLSTLGVLSSTGRSPTTSTATSTTTSTPLLPLIAGAPLLFPRTFWTAGAGVSSSSPWGVSRRRRFCCGFSP